MTQFGTPSSGTPRFQSTKRKAVGGVPADWIKCQVLNGKPIPLLIQPSVDGLDLIAWVAANRSLIDCYLLEHRALLFRGFNIKSVAAFEAFVRHSSDAGLLEYRDRTTPRTTKGDHIYTSTVHPADQRIALHNEGTYWLKWALRLYFCCIKAADRGGETPIADVRNVYRRIDQDIRDRFSRRKMMLVRNYNDGFGLAWQDVYQTQDRAEVERYCRDNNIEFEWKQGNRLRTRQIRPAVRLHPTTQEPVWFNHAAFFHYTSLEPAVQTVLLAEFGIEGLPYNTCYGDGRPIESEVAEHLRSAYEQEKVLFPWVEGDVLLLDNMSIAHAREPYLGAREVVVAMTNSYDGSVVQ